MLVLAIVAIASTAIYSLREREIAIWSKQLETVSLILADHASQTMVVGHGVLDDLAAKIKDMHLRDASDLRVRLASAQVFRMLNDKVQGLPVVDAVTIVALNGDIINFTRYFPAPSPPVNVAERDYFKAHLQGGGLGTEISEPVRNKTTGAWTFYLSRRIETADGQLLGLLLLAISTEAFSDFYAPIGENLGPGAAITLMRRDFTLLTRWPQADSLIGQANRVGVAHKLVEVQGQNHGVVYSRDFRFADNAKVERLVAVRVVKHFPLVVTTAATGELFLASWRRSATVIAVLAAGCALALVGALAVVFRVQRRYETELAHNHELNESLKESESRSRQIIESAPDAMLLVDAQGRIQRMNARAETMFGYRRDALIGQGIETLVPQASRAQHAYERAGYMAHAAPRSMGQGLDLSVQRRDGSLIPVEISLTPMLIQGEPLVLANVVDVSVRKAMEAELRQHRDRLEEQVAERTAELVASRNEAQHLAQVKSRFLAHMSHEIRTPLNAIMGMAYLIRAGGMSAKQTEQIDKLECASNHLLGVINAILDLSKFEAGNFKLAQSPVRVAALLESVATMLRDKAQAKQLALLTQVAEVPPHLQGDATRLRQALLNFADNAIKFTDQGQIVLRVAVLEESADSVLLRFEVQDSGIGIPEDAMPRLFTAFEQADNSMTRRYGGTGLGLAISRMLARLMGGDAGASSVPGQGSCFWFTARLSKAPAAPPPPTGAPQHSAGELLAREHAGYRILLVEDDPVNQEICRALLERVGQVVEVAGNGVEAVRLFRSNSYALVLMDVQMPEMDGLEATRQIRALTTGARVAIVATTANAYAEDATRCLHAGMDDFLPKPLEPERLYAALLTWLPVAAGGSPERPGRA